MSEEWRDIMFGDPNRPSWGGSTGKFAAKFKSREEACGYYYAGKVKGASSGIIALAIGGNRRTISKLLNDRNDNYRDIKAEFKELGAEKFGAKYYTEAISQKLADTKAWIKKDLII